ncbi:abscisic acid 8'-hydroxylase 3 [Iris pallida]|uniref:Abscisic acid 8'-hydroxylase 3 n=1 Tax=Iris pallida TaxID=29817 RepID=A0AAX6EDA7_IRIPA|nr:abscisic acid 8'-hydroxylase 3 [Iris pallida]KAJ6813577.1 abscisic acid 8'-hydroxylase 3 [Iris pallida]
MNKEEQMAIFEANGCGSQPLTWAQTRSMVLTDKVILLDIFSLNGISFPFPSHCVCTYGYDWTREMKVFLTFFFESSLY